jgi:hypothetical protein
VLQLSQRILAAAAISAAPLRAEHARFVGGVRNCEDLVPLPHSHWLIASGMTGPGVTQGHLYLINAAEKTAEILYPRTDGKPFAVTGLNLRPIGTGRYTLYAINHGGGEWVENFEIDARGAKPALAWIGGVPTPSNPETGRQLVANAVTPLPKGAFAITITRYVGGKGVVMIWSPGGGWRRVPGSELPGDNGIEASPDGRWLYINASFEPGVYRLSLGRTPLERALLKTGFFPDNLRWGDDGFLYVAGFAPKGGMKEIMGCIRSGDASCPIPFRVIRVDPQSLRSDEVLAEPGGPLFGMATGVAKVGDEIWVSSVRSTRIAVFGTPSSTIP